MIVLDTNVLSEPMKVEPDQQVLTWLSRVTDAATTAVSVGEILIGVRSLPAGKRRDGLWSAIATMLSSYQERILPYDADAARVYAELYEGRRNAGRPLSVEDGMIAAICRSNGATLATRNVKDFADLGVELIDPWA